MDTPTISVNDSLIMSEDLQAKIADYLLKMFLVYYTSSKFNVTPYQALEDTGSMFRLLLIMQHELPIEDVVLHKPGGGRTAIKIPPLSWMQ